MKRRLLMIFAKVLLVAMVFPVHAHTGDGAAHGYLNGLLHPLSGIDHVLVMLGVGLWGGALAGNLRWLLPLVFLLMMLAGTGFNFVGFSLQAAEFWVAISVLAMGLLLCCRQRVQTSLAISLAALFAFGHGYVHAAEITAGTDAYSYIAGFLLSTILLLGLGSIISLLSPTVFRTIRTGWGLISAVVGLTLLIGV